MSIRKQTIWNPEKDSYGFVDFGNEIPNEHLEKLATEALVFLLVGTRSHWKCPVGYLLADKMNAKDQATLRFNDLIFKKQGERPLLQSLKDEVEGLIKSISADFMDVRHVKATNPKDVDPKNVSFHVPLHEVYLGLAATTTINEIQQATSEDDVDMHNFLENCRNFLIESIEQIQRRFDLGAEIHDVVQCTLPGRAAARVPSSLANVVKKLPHLNTILDTEKLDGEWREHVFEEKLNPDLTWEEYWLIVRDAKVSSGEPKYPNLTKFVEVVASFPFSNAPVERLFSLLKRIKTDDRTRLKSSSLVSLLQCKLAIKNGRYNAATLTPVKAALELISKMKSSAFDGEAKSLKKQFLDKLFS
ncbi:zinc finger MYM-type 1-like [Paramuricea clavata]|uniref:Zinc finger MYM-type 1-like n=1 Tax=Paramuricea clavata TaxID=317549 RepID=A0A6S7HV53_PARCT|nr:zinc finger MYM-type 1-like [Paramuricea clavata]